MGKKLVILFFILILLLVFGSASILIRKKNIKNVVPSPTPIAQKAIPTETISSPQTVELFPPEQKVAKVGEEIIYGKDLNDIINKRYAVDIVDRLGEEEVKKRVLSDAWQDSILIQENIKKGVQLPSSIFNNPDKNSVLRQKMIDDFKAKQKENEEKISGAFISVWYHNVRLPSIPLTDAKELARQKITRVYNELKAGRMTFQQAGETLRNDTSLAQIDKSYTGNAYFEFNDHPKTQKSIVYEPLENQLWQLASGEMSEIIQYPDANIPLGTSEEEFFGLIKVYKHTNQGNGSYQDWLKAEKEKYALTVY